MDKKQRFEVIYDALDLLLDLDITEKYVSEHQNDEEPVLSDIALEVIEETVNTIEVVKPGALPQDKIVYIYEEERDELVAFIMSKLNYVSIREGIRDAMVSDSNETLGLEE